MQTPGGLDGRLAKGIEQRGWCIQAVKKPDVGGLVVGCARGGGKEGGRGAPLCSVQPGFFHGTEDTGGKAWRQDDSSALGELFIHPLIHFSLALAGCLSLLC